MVELDLITNLKSPQYGSLYLFTDEELVIDWLKSIRSPHSFYLLYPEHKGGMWLFPNGKEILRKLDLAFPNELSKAQQMGPA